MKITVEAYACDRCRELKIFTFDDMEKAYKAYDESLFTCYQVNDLALCLDCWKEYSVAQAEHRDKFDKEYFKQDK